MKTLLNLQNNEERFLLIDEDKAPKICIDLDSYDRISSIVELSPQEVSWLSHVTKEDNLYIIDSVHIVEQNVTSVETEMTTEGLSRFMQDTIKKRGVKYFNEIRCWGHSHVNMSVNPSGPDLRQIKKFKDNDYEIMLIFNKSHKLYSALYDFKNNMMYQNVPVSIIWSGCDSKATIKNELDEKIIKNSPLIPSKKMFFQESMRDIDNDSHELRRAWEAMRFLTNEVRSRVGDIIRDDEFLQAVLIDVFEGYSSENNPDFLFAVDIADNVLSTFPDITNKILYGIEVDDDFIANTFAYNTFDEYYIDVFLYKEDE